MRTALERTQERIERFDEEHLDRAAQSIRETFPADRWADLSTTERYWHLDRVGRELTHAFGTAEPMLLEHPLP